jgi:hypothetical protein
MNPRRNVAGSGVPGTRSGRTPPSDEDEGQGRPALARRYRRRPPGGISSQKIGDHLVNLSHGSLLQRQPPSQAPQGARLLSTDAPLLDQRQAAGADHANDDTRPRRSPPSGASLASPTAASQIGSADYESAVAGLSAHATVRSTASSAARPGLRGQAAARVSRAAAARASSAARSALDRPPSALADAIRATRRQ